MKLPDCRCPLLGIALILPVFAVLADHGLPTRDMNPILQPVFLPAYTHPNSNDGW